MNHEAFLMDHDFKPGYQAHTRKLRKWYAYPHEDPTSTTFIVCHYIGDPDTDYIDYEDENSWLPKEFATRGEAEAFAKHLNLKPIPETHTYMEWRD